jgi:GNAT superfamily N-acetyltransferase
MAHRSYLLDLHSTEDFIPRNFGNEEITVIEAGSGQVNQCRHLWVEVGRGFWSERETWSSTQWRQHLGDSTISFCIAMSGTEDVGFFELKSYREEVKIEGFGLLPSWREKGLNGGLLSVATEQAFANGAKRIWLHTATDDHPNALPNYKKRGYRVYH